MARKSQQDQAKAKAQKQKKILIVASVLFVALLAIQGPKTLKMLSGKRAAPTVDASAPTFTPATTTTAAPTSTPTAPSPSTAAPSLSSPVPTSPTPSSGSQLVSAVQPVPDPGQLEQFYRFASKDPFAVQVASGATAASVDSPASSSSTSATSGSSGSTTKTTTTTTTPPPSSAVISLNGTLVAVAVNGAFPTSGPVFDQVGSPLFQLSSLTQTTAKVKVVGGSYADGSAALTLTVGKSVTLQNTADGSRYTLILEPQGTQVPATAGSSSPATTAPATTTPVVPSGG
jgi:hypothetical protein